MAAGAGSFPEWAAETGGVRRWLAVRWEWIQHRCWGWKARPWGERGRGAQRRQWSSPPWRRRTDPLSGLSAPGGEWPADPLYRGISEQRPGKWVRPVPACVTQKSHLFGYHRRCQPNQCFKSNGIVFQLAVVRSNWMWSISYEMDFCQLNCLECEWNLCGSSKNVKMWRKLLT